VVAGAIFLSSPHFVGDKHEAKRAIDRFLKCQHKGFGVTVASDGDVEVLMSLCKAFDCIALEVPVVSAYETKETSAHRGIFAKFRSKGLVCFPNRAYRLRSRCVRTYSSAGYR
jgi:hypothetical protein